MLSSEEVRRWLPLFRVAPFLMTIHHQPLTALPPNILILYPCIAALVSSSRLVRSDVLPLSYRCTSRTKPRVPYFCS